jgi:hypothetical protein
MQFSGSHALRYELFLWVCSLVGAPIRDRGKWFHRRDCFPTTEVGEYGLRFSTRTSFMPEQDKPVVRWRHNENCGGWWMRTTGADEWLWWMREDARVEVSEQDLAAWVLNPSGVAMC